MIRHATLSDVDFILDTGFDMLQEGHYSLYEYDFDKTRALITGLINSDVGMVIVSEGRGWMMCACVEQWFSSDKIAFDYGLYIKPEFRGGTDAYRMISEYKKWAEGKGASEIRIGASTGVNTEAVSKLYERSNFKRLGVIYTRS